MKTTLLAAGLAVLAQAVPSLAGNISRRSRGIKTQSHPNPEMINNGTFEQMLDHNDPSKGTFPQRYWFDYQYWTGPGAPVFVFNVGEAAADDYVGYLYNGTIPGRYALEFGGAVIVIEHRYWGESIPFTTLDAETLQYLDLPQSVYDMTYFAKNVKLDFDDSNGGANADQSPWVLIGGSYPGALAAWTAVLDPGVFWAYHASSAVVEAIYDYYPYFDAVEMGIPRNCSNDIKSVISYVDYVFANGSETDIADLKEMFGLEMVEHQDDFAETITGPMWQWQESFNKVFRFCDYIETSSSSGHVVSGHEGGVGLDAALTAYAAWIKTNVAPGCENNGCSTYDNIEAWNDPTDLTGNRQWDWMLCHNPFSWWQVGPPTNDGQHVVSSMLRPDHFQKQCKMWFPEVNGYVSGSDAGWTAEHLNMYTGGWDAEFERVMFVNGQFDPWLTATVSSPYRPDGPREATDTMPIFTIENGGHVPDLIIDDIPEEVSVISKEIEVMKKWLSEWPGSQSSKKA